MTMATSGAAGFRKILGAAHELTERIKLNAISHHYRRGRRVVVKRRNVFGRAIAGVTNFFFGLAGVPIRFCGELKDWQEWEVGCYRMLNGKYEVFALGERKVVAERLPGESLFEHLKRGTLRARMLRAAGQEFRRAHGLWSARFGGPWSHGDATMSNVIYDEGTERARLIDFEIVHMETMTAAARHADDLLVFLLDLVGFAPKGRWRSSALCFLHAYGDEEAIGELRKRLRAPRGLARIWWKVRTNFVDSGKIERRLDLLARALDQGAGAVKTRNMKYETQSSMMEMNCG